MSDVEICCSFCAKSRREVEHIIAGKEVFICNECVGLCVDILADEHRANPWLSVAFAAAREQEQERWQREHPGPKPR